MKLFPPRSGCGAGGPAEPDPRRLLDGLRSARAAVLCLVLVGSAAHAGLFDDEEARKAILDLRARIAQLAQGAQASDEQAKARAGEAAAVNAQLLEQVNTLKRSLLDLNNQLEVLRGDIAKLRGSDEQIARDVAELQRRQKDITQGIDDRLRKVEPVKVSLDGREFLAEPEERRSYEDSVAALRGGDFDKAALGLAAFVKRYPASGYGESARFWLGNAQYARRDYKEAIATFRAFVTASPEHPRAAEAMLAIANSQAEMKDAKAARKTLDDLLKAYPKSEAAVAGKERLASLK